MPSCVVKQCRNQSEKHLKKDGYTFHSFPKRDPFSKCVWINLVRKERNDNTWVPSTYSVICSDHFRSEDFYITKKGLRRLKKRAIPKNLISKSEVDFRHIKREYDIEKEYMDDDSYGMNSEYSEDDDAHTEKGDTVRRGYPTHTGVMCTFCVMEIVGHRYMCVQCLDVSLCGACEAAGCHPRHCVLRIPNPNLYRKVMSRLGPTLTEMFKKNTPLEEPQTSRNETHFVLETNQPRQDPTNILEGPPVTEYKYPRKALKPKTEMFSNDITSKGALRNEHTSIISNPNEIETSVLNKCDIRKTTGDNGRSEVSSECCTLLTSVPSQHNERRKRRKPTHLRHITTEDQIEVDNTKDVGERLSTAPSSNLLNSESKDLSALSGYPRDMLVEMKTEIKVEFEGECSDSNVSD